MTEQQKDQAAIERVQEQVDWWAKNEKSQWDYPECVTRVLALAKKGMGIGPLCTRCETVPGDLDEAVERCEALAESDEPWDPGVPTIHDRAALRTLIDHAKRQPKWALGEGERHTLEALLGHHSRWRQDKTHEYNKACSCSECGRVVPALRAALAIEEPFTAWELDYISSDVGEDVFVVERQADQQALPKMKALLAKLDRMIAAMEKNNG